MMLEGRALTETRRHGVRRVKMGKSFRFESRHDNLVCAAVVAEEAIIVKTVMVNWKERDTP
jgi:hypothetical protein